MNKVRTMRLCRDHLVCGGSACCVVQSVARCGRLVAKLTQCAERGIGCRDNAPGGRGVACSAWHG